MPMLLRCVSVVVLAGGLFVNSVTAQTVPFTEGEFVRKVDPAISAGINFSSAFKADFNNDGVIDKVICSNADHSVKVFDGKKLNTVLYAWEGPATNTIATNPDKPRELSNRSYTGCITAEFVSGRPSIVISNSYVHPVLGFRIPAEQYVLLNKGVDEKTGLLKMIPRPIRKSDNTMYRAPVRSVKCTPYPEQLVRAGHTPGILCFYAGYDQGLPGGYGDRVALLKLEDQDGTLVTKDLTGSAGLPWKGGMEGTLMGVFRTYKNSSGTLKSDGLSMMDGAWIDYDKDGLSDLITVGQHSSIWAFKLAINETKPEGISFTKTDIMTASNVSMTEFLTVSAFDEQDSRIQLPCVYVSGEAANINALKSYDVPDHVRCFENGVWVTRLLPGLPAGKGYSSSISGASIKIDAAGRILAQAPSFYYNSAGVRLPMTPPTNLFEFNPSDTCQVKLDSVLTSSDRTTVLKTMSQTMSVAKGATMYIGGWVDCNATKHSAYFTGTTFVSGTSNITQLGWWTEANFLAHQATFQSIPYKGSGSFVAATGKIKSVTLWNGCSRNGSKITATVMSCTNNVEAPILAVHINNEGDQSSELLSASTIAKSALSGVLDHIQDVITELSSFLSR